MQGNVFIRNSSGQMEERAVTDGDGIVLNPGEEILIAAEADTTEIHYESDTRAVIRLEGIGEFSVESDTTLPEKIALAPPFALQGQQPLGIAFEEASPPTGPDLTILQDTPLMHQAGADSTSYADRPTTPPVDFIAPEALRFNFDYLSMQEGEFSGGAGGRQRDLDDLAAPIVFDYSADDDGPFIADPFASLPVLIVSTTASGDEDSAIYLDIRAELTDTDGSETLIVIISGLPDGSVLSAGTNNGDGTWTLTEDDLPGLTITPPQDWEQDFDITVTAVATESSTGHTASVTETISVTITPVNDPPVAGAVDLGQIDEDTSLLITTDQLLSNSYDVDAGDVLTITDVSINSFYGTIVNNGDGTWTFTPKADYHGDGVALTFTIEDTSGATSTNVATFDILPVNDAPVVGNVDLGDTHLETGVTFSRQQLLSNTYDVDGDTLSITDVSVDPALGSITHDAATDIWTFTPAAGVTGDDLTISFTVSDGQISVSGNALVDVIDDPSGNRPPVADDVDLGQIGEDTSITVTAAQFLRNSHDPDGDPLSIASVTVNPYYGTVTDNGNGTWTFTPAENYHGYNVALTFTVTDGKGGEATAVAAVDVLSVNDLPVAGDVDLGQINEDTSITFTAAQLLANSYDPDNDPLSIASVTVNPYYGTVTDNGDGTWTYTPKHNFWGNDVRLSFTVADDDGYSKATATLDVLGVNDAPVAGGVDLGQCQAGEQRIIYMHELLAGSHDPDGDILLVAPDAVTVDARYGTITYNGDNTWTFTPADGFTGDDVQIRFLVNDGALHAGAVALIDVVEDPSGNQPPITGPVYLGSTDEDTALTFSSATLLLTTFDPDGDPLTVTSVTVNPHYGQIADNGDGTWTFTPFQDFHGDNIPLTFTVSDGRGGVSTNVGLVDVLPVNDAPVAGTVDLGQILEDHSLTITQAQLLANSFDVDGDVLGISSVTVDPAIGSIIDNLDGTWTFTPTVDLNGDDLPITFTVDDGNGGTATATAILDILPVNDPPVAGDVNLGIINEDTSVTFSRHVLLSNTSDPEGDLLDVTGVSVLPEHGSLTDNGDGTWTFTPAQDFNGTAAITFAVTDSNGGAATAQAMMAILPVNDPPIAGNVYLGTMDEDTSINFMRDQLLANSHDADGDSLRIAPVVTVNPFYGTVVGAASDLHGNIIGWTFTPAPNFNGDSVPLTFTVIDANGAWSTAVATVDVRPVNDAPVVGGVDLGQTYMDTSITFSAAQLLANAYDPDGDAMSVSLVSVEAANGAITDNGDGTWTFTPAAGFTGTDVAMTFTVGDGNGGTATALAMVDVTGEANRPPVAGNVDLGNMQEDTSITVTATQLLAGSSDPDGDTLTIASVSVNPYYGAITNNGNGTWTFTPTENFHGDEVPLTFTVSDANGGTASAVALVDVIAAPDIPIAGNVNLGQIPEDHSITFTMAQLLANTSEADGDLLSITSVSVNPAAGSVANNGDGTWTFTPTENFHGAVNIAFTVADKDGQASAQANLTVLSVNDPPLAVDVDLGQCEAGARHFTAAELLANSSDVEGDPLSIVTGSVAVHPDFGQIHDLGGGQWIYVAAEGYSGEDVPISFRVSDGDLEVTAAAVIDVETPSGNHAPQAQDMSMTILEDTPLTFTQDMFASSVSDPDGDPLTITHIFLDTPEAGSLANNGDGTWTFTPGHNSEVDAMLTYVVSDGHVADVARIDMAVDAVADPLNATNSTLGYIDGLYKLNLDFSAQFPENDGSEIYTLLYLSGLEALPADAQLLVGDDAGDVIWSSGDGDTLTLTQEQALGLTNIFVKSQSAASFDITVHTRTVEQSNGDTAYGTSTVHFDILNPPQLATFEIASTDPDMPDVFWYQNGPDTTGPASISYAIGSFGDEYYLVYDWDHEDGYYWDYDLQQYDIDRFLTFANNPILFNNADPTDPDAVINSVNWFGDARNSIHIEGFSTEINTLPGYDGTRSDSYNGDPNVAVPYYNFAHGAMFDSGLNFWGFYDSVPFRWDMDDQGNPDYLFSPHLRQQYGDQSMQIVSKNEQNGINFFEAQSVIIGYMNESIWLQKSETSWPESYRILKQPDYLQAGWDDRIVFGINGTDNTLHGDDSIGGDAKNNILIGFDGNDTLTYGAGNDSLFAGAGNDQLIIDTAHHNGFIDAYALTGYVIPTMGPNFSSRGEYGYFTVVEGKIDGGEGYDVLSLGPQAGEGNTTLFLNYAEHWIGYEPRIYNDYPWETTNSRHHGPASFKYNMINIEEIDITGDADDANTLSLNVANVWLVTSNEYDKTLYVTGDANDTLEIRDQANWHYVDSDATHHHLVSTTGLAHLYVDKNVNIHVVGDEEYRSSYTLHFDSNDNPIFTLSESWYQHNDSLYVDEFFHTARAGGGNDTITIDSSLHYDGTIAPTDFTHIDGGDGFDVLKFGVNPLLVTGTQMDLTAFGPDQILNIEAIDITGNIRQANTLTLDAASVIDVTDADNALYIRGDANDTVHLADSGSWSHAGTSDLSGVTYDHYTGLDAFGTTADLYVQQELMTNLAHP